MADASILPVDPLRVVIKSSPEAVAYDMSERLYAAAMSAIADRGHFVLAIPGGSILKMLNNTKPAWASRATVVYVNHKCVDMADEEQSTHAKAQKIFMSNWVNVTTIVLGGSGDAKAEATAYEAQIRALPETTLPRDAMGKPVFDMMLIGVGDDGHVGSLYPGREEVGMTEGWVLPVEMKSPGSITLSLPLMASAKSVIIAACGVSEKYPEGKSDAMKRAIEGVETPSTFPAVGLRRCATWILDNAAASKLSPVYLQDQ